MNRLDGDARPILTPTILVLRGMQSRTIFDILTNTCSRVEGSQYGAVERKHKFVQRFHISKVTMRVLRDHYILLACFLIVTLSSPAFLFPPRSYCVAGCIKG